MKLLITGACGFVGSTLAEAFRLRSENLSIIGVDNLMRPGSEYNRGRLRKLGVEFVHADIRCASDFEALPAVDWVIDAAANPSVLAGVRGASSGTSRQLLEHNLIGMLNVLEYCKQHRSGLLLLSSSRVYSIPALTALPLRDNGSAFELDGAAPQPAGLSNGGIDPDFSTTPPVSLYGSTKLASEILALEYGAAFGFPVWITRCGVLAGPGQFGTPEQGIFAYWVNAYLRRRPLRFIGFDGAGKQVRDAMHPLDLAALLDLQMQKVAGGRRVYTAGGGPANAMSLSALHAWCAERFGGEKHVAASDPTQRTFDIPWIVMDNTDARRDFGWSPEVGLQDILERIADHAEQHPDWLQRSGLA